MLRTLRFLRNHPAPVLLFAFPWILLAVNPNWPFANGGNCDPWFYYGFFTNYPQLYQVRPHYDGERLPVILPGYLFHQLFSPTVATVLLHVTFFYIAIFSLFYTLKQLHDQRTALLTTLLLSCHSFFVGAMGWDYGDGFGIAYYLLAIALLIRSVTAAWPSVWIGLCGMVSAALFYTYPLWLIFLPFFPLYYALPVRASGRRPLWSAILVFGACFAMGFAGLTAFFSLLNHWVGGSYNFYRYSLKTMFAVSELPTWHNTDFRWLSTATWDVFPLILFLAAVLYILVVYLAKKERPGIITWLFLANFIWCFLAFSYLTFVKGRRILEFDYYASSLLPLMFLVIGSVFLSGSSKVRLPVFLFVVGAAAVVCVLPLWKHWWYPAMFTDLPLAHKHPGVVNHYLLGCCAVGLTGLVLRIFFRDSRLTWLACVFALCAADFGLVPAFTRATWVTGYRGAAFYERVTKAIEVVKMQTGIETPPYFWFSLDDKENLDHRAIARTLLAHQIVDMNFPRVAPGYTIPPGSLVLILTEKQDIIDVAQNALGTLGLTGSGFTQIKITDRTDSYWMTFVRVKQREPTHTEGLSFSHSKGPGYD
jgi:hypothetical protein